MKKIVKTIVGVFLAIFLFAPSSNAAKLTGSLGNINFTTSDYDNKDVDLNYYNNDYKKICEIRDKYTGELLETISLEPDFSNPVTSRTNSMVSSRSGWVGPNIFRRSKSFGRTVVELSIPVEFYSNGSFRQVNYIGTPYLGITNSITNTQIEGSSPNAWAKNNKLPTTTIFYSYSGTLLATVSSGSSSGISGELLGAGFSFSHSVGSTTYFRRPISSSGAIYIN